MSNDRKHEKSPPSYEESQQPNEAPPSYEESQQSNESPPSYEDAIRSPTPANGADAKRNVSVSQGSLFNQVSELDKQQFEKLQEYKVSAKKYNNLKSILPKFLQSVAYGQEAEAKNMLEKNPELLLMKGSVTDYSGRHFEPLTGYQLATWALDWRMRDMFKTFMDRLNRDEADRQFNEVKTQGIVYKIAASALMVKQFDDQGNEIKSDAKNADEKKGVAHASHLRSLLTTLKNYIFSDEKTVTVRESHYNFGLYLDTLKMYVDNYKYCFAGGDGYDKWSRPKAIAYWCQTVGGMQRLFPAYLAQEYCEPNRPFWPIPDFSKTEFARSLDCHDYVTDKATTWFPLRNSKLGTHFGIYHMDYCRGDNLALGVPDPGENFVKLDLDALTALYNMLQQKFPGLTQQPQQEVNLRERKNP